MSSAAYQTLRASGDAHWRVGAPWPALADWTAALALNPADKDLRFNIAVAHKALRNLDLATALFSDLVSGDRRLEALAHLSDIAPQRISADLEAEIAAAASDAGLPLDLRCVLAFNLGKVREQQGRYDAAFAAFAAGAALKAASLCDEPRRSEQEEADFLKFIKATFTADFLRREEDDGDPTTAPIFIVGLPRSGTTLVEQILASHPAVMGLGESEALNRAVSGRHPYDPAAAAPPGHYQALAADYLAAMRAQGWDGAGRFVDKTPANLWAVGMIHLMFPRAVILHTVRHPADTCLSNFQQLFEAGNPLSYDLAGLGRQYVRYHQAMDHWRAVLPGRVTDVRLEELTTDPDAQIRALVTAAGLPWDDACLAFHANPRPVRTASANQVRQPMSTAAQDRWRHYAPHLAPLLEALGPYAPT